MSLVPQNSFGGGSVLGQDVPDGRSELGHVAGPRLLHSSDHVPAARVGPGPAMHSRSH